MDDLIKRQDAIDAINCNIVITGKRNAEEVASTIGTFVDRIKALPSAEPESFEDERKKIADALSEKMAYMNTCLNERDIILSYLGVKRPIGTHCNSDCRNEKCESYHYATKELPSAGPERMKGKWIRITQGTMPGQYMCPFCHRTIENYGVEELLSIRYPYCHCGADMRGGSDETIAD